MAHDFEDLHDIDDLSDDELRDLVRDSLQQHPAIDAASILVQVEDGVVRLAGRVGTVAELRTAEHLVTDVLGIATVENEILVDPIARAESPEAIDDHMVEEESVAGVYLADLPRSLSSESEHLEEDLDAELFGTTEVGKAISLGASWNPPTGPTPEGLSGTDASVQERDEDH
jgi:hypothetical protein